MRVRALLAGAALLLVPLVAATVARGARNGAREPVPTTRVKRGTLSLRSYASGEIRPTRSALLMGPAVGGSLQLVAIVPTGTLVKAGDVIAEFDPSEQEFNLEQARSEQLEAGEEIAHNRLEAQIREAQDDVALLQARFEVRRAELEVQRNELTSAIEARKNLLNLEEVKRRLSQLEKDIPTRRASARAGLTVLTERRKRADLKVLQAQRAIEEMKLRAPVAGLVSLKENRGMGFFGPGMSFPELRIGDLVNPGTPVAEVLPVGAMAIQAKVEENDRANVRPGQAAQIKVEALPGESFAGKVEGVAGLAARRSFIGGTGPKKFDMTVALAKPDPRFRPGMTVQVVLGDEDLQNVLLLPRQVVFEREGQSVVYLRAGSGFEMQKVKVVRRSDSLAAVEGLREGSEVAMVDPEDAGRAAKKPPAGAPPAMGGGR